MGYRAARWAAWSGGGAYYTVQAFAERCGVLHTEVCFLQTLPAVYLYGMFSGDVFRQTAVYGHMRADTVCFLRLFMYRMTAKNKGSVPNIGKNPCGIPLQTTACQK